MELEKIQSVKKKDPNLPEVGTYIYLTDMKIYGFVKSKIEEDMYEVVVNDFEQEMFLFPLHQQKDIENEEKTIFRPSSMYASTSLVRYTIQFN